MEDTLPVKRKHSCMLLTVIKDKIRLGDIHRFIVGFFTSQPLPEWCVLDQPEYLQQIVLIFLPGLDSTTLKTLKSTSPYLNSQMSTTGRYCKIDNASKRGYLNDFLILQEPVSFNIPNHLSGIDLFLVQPEDFSRNNYPQENQKSYVKTSSSGTHKGPLGIDCEMIKTSCGTELARVSLVDSKYHTLYDEYVIPQGEVIDYLTKYSGITKNHISSASKTFSLVQNDILNLINSEAILCGHSLENDLQALKLFHKRIADTALLFPHSNWPSKNSLKSLAQKFLKKTIQNGSHNSIEDAITALQLFQLKLKLGMSFGVPQCIYKENHLCESLAQTNSRTVAVGLRIPNELIKGNLSVDYGGKVKKYLISEYNVIICEWREIKKLGAKDRQEDIKEIVKKWDMKIKKLVERFTNTMFIVANGEGDTSLANHLDQMRNEQFFKWTIEQERAWRQAQLNLNQNFALFCTPD
ncbi:hypothetical protein SteCoe_31284 [Stentor coeruleus]|uniref:Exonuclease domain-containing protein n=1 Tax=Stentor coeruleus TaxID=5963 RepID=A0A1R2B1L8_9CILI|nr:hypothetical protein SteCoe_31284 [Stentor coeruleus]